jgi:hypothetical protein
MRTVISMGKKEWRVKDTISVLALIVSLFVSFGALAFTLWFNLSPGNVQPLKPSGYSIIRGIDSFPSDHIVLPLEWGNTGGRPVLVRHPYLVLHELGPDGKETGNKYRFFLAGEYPDISYNSFAERYRIKQSFILDPHSISLKVLVFHIEGWWNESKSNDLYKFRFTGGKNYRVYIGYQKNLDEQPKVELFEMLIFGTVDNLHRNGTKGYWWDFFPL